MSTLLSSRSLILKHQRQVVSLFGYGLEQLVEVLALLFNEKSSFLAMLT